LAEYEAVRGFSQNESPISLCTATSSKILKL